MGARLGRPRVTVVCAVFAIALSSTAAPPAAADQATGGGLLGASVLVWDIGNRLSVATLTDFVTRAGLKLVVIDWAWASELWGATDFDAVNDLIASLSSRDVRVAAMYRPRFPARATVATQVTAAGKPAVSSGAEICYSDARAREWGSAWGTKILGKCPGFEETIVYNPRSLCRCPACTRAAAGPAGPYGPVWEFLAEAKSAWRACKADIKLGVVGITDRAFWEAGKGIVDTAYPFFRVRDDTDIAREAEAAVSACDAIGAGPRVCLARITWSVGDNPSPLVLAAVDAAAKERRLQYVLWTMDSAFLSSIYDPEVVAQATGLDWGRLEPTILALRDQRNAPQDIAGLPLLATMDPDRQDRRPVAGRYAVVTDLAPEDPYYAAAELLAEHRKVAVTRVPSEPAEDLIAALQSLEAEQVAFVTRPDHIEPNLAATVFLASATMDHDVELEFSYGFITGEDAQDAVALVQRTIEAEREPPSPRRAVCIGHVFAKAEHCYRDMEAEARGYAGVGFATDTIRFDEDDRHWEDRKSAELAKLDGATALAFCGHGSGDVACGLNGEDLARAQLNHAVVYNGACFSNATSVRWGTVGRGQANWQELPAGTSIVLGLIHAGAVASVGSVVTSSYAYVAPAMAASESGACMGEAALAAQNGALQRGSVGKLDLRRGSPGALSPLCVTTGESGAAITAAGIVLIGDPAYVPYPGGIPGAATRTHAGEGFAPTTPPLAPDALLLTAGSHELVLAPRNGRATVVIEYLPTEPFGAMVSQPVADNAPVRPLWHFDLSGASLAEGAGLRKATLRLYCEKSSCSGPVGQRSIGLHLVREAWHATVTWRNAPRFDEKAFATIPFADKTGWVEVDVTQQALDWLSAPQDNFGFLAKFSTEGEQAPATWTLTGPMSSDEAKRPRIVFDCE